MTNEELFSYLIHNSNLSLSLVHAIILVVVDKSFYMDYIPMETLEDVVMYHTIMFQVCIYDG